MRHSFPARWKKHKLDELGFVGRGKSRHRPRNEPSLYGGKYPFFQTGDIKAANLYLSEYSQTYNEKGLEQSKLWEPGTLCITIAANIADTAILGIRGCFPDSVIGFIADLTKADVRFTKYYIDLIKLDMQQVSHGTTQDNLSLDKLLRFDFVVPDVNEQCKIASILSAYDDLIENNLRRIKILEEMAQNLYREWFVKFRFPGHQRVRFVDSSLGRIPEGWKVVKIGNLIEIRKGKNITKNTIVQGSVPVVAGGMSPAYYHNASNTRQPVITISASGANSGFVCLYHENVWASDCSVIDMNTTPYVYYFYLQLKHRQTDITRLQRGSAQPHVYSKDLMDLDTIDVPSDFLDKFNLKVIPIIQMIRNLTQRNTTLRRTRDLLLPKLISGEVDVSELDINIPEEAEG